MMHERFSKMLNYATNEERCRSRILAEYFGDSEATDCGICDVCLAQRKRNKAKTPNDNTDLQRLILEKIAEREMTVRDLIAEFHSDPQPLLDMLKQMHENALILTDNSGVIRVAKS